MEIPANHPVRLPGSFPAMAGSSTTAANQTLGRWRARARLWHGVVVSDELPAPRCPRPWTTRSPPNRRARSCVIFLLGPPARPRRGVGPGCLSQWWPVTFSEDGHVFASAEHYMMAHKAVAVRRPRRPPPRSSPPGHPARPRRSAGPCAASTRRSGMPARFEHRGPRQRRQVRAAPRTAGVPARHPKPGPGRGQPPGPDLGHRPDRRRRARRLPATWRGLNLLGFAPDAARTTLAATS